MALVDGLPMALHVEAEYCILHVPKTGVTSLDSKIENGGLPPLVPAKTPLHNFRGCRFGCIIRPGNASAGRVFEAEDSRSKFDLRRGVRLLTMVRNPVLHVRSTYTHWAALGCSPHPTAGFEEWVRLTAR